MNINVCKHTKIKSDFSQALVTPVDSKEQFVGRCLLGCSYEEAMKLGEAYSLAWDNLTEGCIWAKLIEVDLPKFTKD